MRSRRLIWGDLREYPFERLPLAIVDVETTGLAPEAGDRVCEVAVVLAEGGLERERFVTLVNPGRSISRDAMAVNGISNAMVRNAPRFAQVAGRVVDLLGQGVLVAHNAPFDLGFLDAELARCRLKRPTVPVVDTLAIARRCFTFPGNSLPTIARFLGISGGAHRALGDVLTTWQVLQRFVDHLGGPALTLGELLARQQGQPPPLPAGLAEALQPGRRVRLVYLSVEGGRTERWVEPIEVTNRGGAAYLLAYCFLRKEQRTFRVDRIVEWEVGG